MVYRVHLTARAERDAEEIMLYLQQRSRTAAVRWHHRLMKAIEELEENPDRFGLAPESGSFDRELRQLLFGKRRGVYRILFTVEGDSVSIVHIRHGARDWLKPKEL